MVGAQAGRTRRRRRGRALCGRLHCKCRADVLARQHVCSCGIAPRRACAVWRGQYMYRTANAACPTGATPCGSRIRHVRLLERWRLDLRMPKRSHARVAALVTSPPADMSAPSAVAASCRERHRRCGLALRASCAASSRPCEYQQAESRSAHAPASASSIRVNEDAWRGPRRSRRRVGGPRPSAQTQCAARAIVMAPAVPVVAGGHVAHARSVWHERRCGRSKQGGSRLCDTRHAHTTRPD